jgi:hypothetical protein
MRNIAKAKEPVRINLLTLLAPVDGQDLYCNLWSV